MIIEGSHYPFGTVLDDDVIPLNLRKSVYLTTPGDKTVQRVDGVEEISTEMTDLEEELDVQDYEQEELRPVKTAAEKRKAKFVTKTSKG